MTEGSRRKKRSTRSVTVTTAIGLALVMVVPLGAEAQPYHSEYVNKLAQGVTERVSVSSSGEEGNGDSGVHSQSCGGHGGYSASDNGRFVAFESWAGNLHPGDVNGQTMRDVFVFDRKTKKLQLVSVLETGLSPEAPPSLDVSGVCQSSVGSSGPKISGNGRFVAFLSNLPLTGGSGGPLTSEGLPRTRVYVRDLKKQKTELVSGTWNGDPPDGPSGNNAFPGGNNGLAISDNGRWVTFTSAATNIIEGACSQPDLAPGVPNPIPVFICNQIYARDRSKNETVLVSRSTNGEPANQDATRPSISGNGRYVAFQSGADNLDPNDIDLPLCSRWPYCINVFVHDLRTGATELVSSTRDGGRAIGAELGAGIFGGRAPGAELGPLQAGISDDGRFVTFRSSAGNLVPADPPPQTATVCNYGQYVKDRKTGRVERVSVSSTGARLHLLGWPDISDSGRYASVHVFSYYRNCLTNSTDEADAYEGDFLLDRATGQLDWVSCAGTNFGAMDNRDKGCPKVSDDSYYPLIGGNGRFIVGVNYASDVVPGDRNKAYDVFVREIGRYPLGTGPLGGSPLKKQDPPSDDICIAPDVCIPPQGKVARLATTASSDAPSLPEAKLYGASLAYRPELGDLFAAIELEHMGPALTIGPAGVVTGGLPSILYGLRFEAKGKSYEVRASSLAGGTFGLFDCTDTAPLCTQVAILKGGYGTTGERVVVSLPLDEIGLEKGGKLKNVEAFSAIGSLTTGATKLLDRLAIK